ncbi:hypothetical protein AXF42_Ash000770 [Apostasia shenzhenica]|uniref:Uncharacterized protein n=1 Tax=Apostasia shenzhenica TaxID=1088818 RepID=A0A2I0AHB0_9ASPA|nr:hypothetical protein AXF42_Ash000770 [Apostasia shenzhenica]
MLEMTFGQVLSLVRNIAAEEAQENQYRITEEKMEYDEMIQSLEKELEAIKFALKSRNTKIEDLNRELLRISMVDAQKSKGGLWKWLCPATTTIVAAVSLAYAARAR